MAALQSIRPAVSGVVRNPILVAVTALFGLSQLPNLLVQPGQPILAGVLSLATFGVMVLALPFFQGGVLGMASEALAGRTSLGTLVATGKANYVSLLLGYFVLLALNLVFGFVTFMGVLIAVVGGSVGGVDAASGFGANTTLLVVAAIVGVGLLLAYIVVTVFIQFYAHAVVLDGTDLVAGFRRSAGLVRSNLLSVIGYTVILGAGSLLVGTLAAAASFVFTPQPPGSPAVSLISIDQTPALLVAGAVGYILLTGVFGALYATYSVAFYERISPGPVAGDA
ncbi:hypothetical protein [Halorubrum trueperi]|uniref:DUF7847 domain-containing protein n=1 Tax=Halorubrum trueperi TaxID=2004704 RepID=A0ABD5ULI7_9EURY